MLEEEIVVVVLCQRYITARKLARLLGISVFTAGRLLSRLEKLGVVERVSRRVYRVKSIEELCAYKEARKGRKET